MGGVPLTVPCAGNVNNEKASVLPCESEPANVMLAELFSASVMLCGVATGGGFVCVDEPPQRTRPPPFNINWSLAEVPTSVELPLTMTVRSPYHSKK